MSRNIVICCDGTNNQYKHGENTNVYRLYSSLVRDENQIIFYDPGIGAVGAYNAMTSCLSWLQRIMGLAFGYGLRKNVFEAYAFLMQNYQKGDNVFFYGFSRGAYTVRVLAGMIKKIGLLYPDNQNMLDEAFRLFGVKDNWRESAGFKRSFGRECPIHFLGLWDTVSSVGSIWSPKTFPYTARNNAVKNVRHAMAIDEKRAFFRQNLWNETKTFKGQDIRQVWFAGVHSDVGGGYLEQESGLAKISLEWMLVESKEFGLRVDYMAAQKALKKHDVPHFYKRHQSLSWKWVLAEFIPKVTSFRVTIFKRLLKKEWIKWIRVNLFRRRKLPTFDTSQAIILYEDTVDRINSSEGSYKPSNLIYQQRAADERQLDTRYKIEKTATLRENS